MKVCFLGVAILIISSTARAFGPPQPNGLSFSIGPGAGYSPKYTGSDEKKAEVIPYFDISFTHNRFKTFISIQDGAGIKIFGPQTGLFFSAGADLGDSRKREDDSSLKGTANVNCPLKYFMKAGLETEAVDFSICANYFPVETRFFEKGKNRRYNAFTASPRIMTGYPFAEWFVLQAELGLTFMDGRFAKAYHSVLYETPQLPEYNAAGGLHDAYSEFTFVFMFGEHLSVAYQGRYERLTGDAGRSPLTKDKNMIYHRIFTAYTF